MGRGTTVIEAALAGRTPAGCDINPLSAMLAQPRLSPPTTEEVARRLAALDLSSAASCPRELEGFYHPETLREICALREYLLARDSRASLDGVDRWIQMVAVNRLTGHSPGFFSVYTLPPNQAASAEQQLKINARLDQKPEYRNIRELILRKSVQLQTSLTTADRLRLRHAAAHAQLIEGSAAATRGIYSNSVQLTVTSPPFLDVVQYVKDNWLRCWF